MHALNARLVGQHSSRNVLREKFVVAGDENARRSRKYSLQPRAFTERTTHGRKCFSGARGAFDQHARMIARCIDHMQRRGHEILFERAIAFDLRNDANARHRMRSKPHASHCGNGVRVTEGEVGKSQREFREFLIDPHTEFRWIHRGTRAHEIVFRETARNHSQICFGKTDECAESNTRLAFRPGESFAERTHECVCCAEGLHHRALTITTESRLTKPSPTTRCRIESVRAALHFDREHAARVIDDEKVNLARP